MAEYLFCNLPFRCFRRALIQSHQLRFDTGLAVGEDQAFIFAYAMYIGSLVSTSKLLYNVILEKEDSLSRKRRDYLAEQLMRVNDLMFQALDSSNVSGEIRDRYKAALAWTFYRSAYSVCKELLKYDLSKLERRKRIKKICMSYKMKKVKACDLKCKIIAFPVIYGMAGVIDILCRNR